MATEQTKAPTTGRREQGEREFVGLLAAIFAAADIIANQRNAHEITDALTDLLPSAVRRADALIAALDAPTR